MFRKELKEFVIEINGWEKVSGLPTLCVELESEGIESIICNQPPACINADREGEKRYVQWKGIAPMIPWTRLSEQPETALILTDRQESVDQAVSLGIACVGFEGPEEEEARPVSVRYLSGVDMVVQGLEETGAEFYRLVWQRHHGIPWTIAQTERLVIRESVPEDFDALHGFEREPGALDYMPAPEGDPEQERQSFEAYIREVYPFYSYGLWTVILRENGRIIGRVGLENGTWQGKPVVAVGYLIGQAFQGKGYGLEAVKAVTAYGLEAVGAEALYAFIDERNEKSVRLIQKAGYRKCGSNDKGICTYKYRG